MLTDYLPIAVLIVLSTAVAVAAIVLGTLFGPHRPTAVKSEPYESGMRPFGAAMRRVSPRFYLVAVLFILFDIETIFFLPWALTYQSFIAQSLGGFAFGEMLIFVGILMVGYVWVWKKGALEWE